MYFFKKQLILLLLIKLIKDDTLVHTVVMTALVNISRFNKH